MSSIDDIIAQFKPISLKEMDAVQLMNRTDTKFPMSALELKEILMDIVDDYFVLEIEGVRFNRYKTLYFDTPKKRFYMNHHNSKPSRYKVRMRKYLDSELCFLEVKYKSKGRTDKRRKKINDFSYKLSSKKNKLISDVFNESMELEPTLWNSFSRVTLVNKIEKERITIDLNLAFEDFLQPEKKLTLNYLVIVEVKQENINRNSIFVRKAKELGIRSSGMSKYCTGMALLNKDLKSNDFKSNLLKIEKIKQLNKAS